MAREKPPEPPAEDIPAWFMTYSDVITLLMTFFILLLTFSTTEPDRFERIQRSIFAGGKGSGAVGEPVKGPETESFIQRVRPRAARLAMAGSEMPPYQNSPSRTAVGEGLKSVTDDEAKQDVMKVNQFEVPIKELVSEKAQMRARGMQLAATLAAPLSRLPVHVTVQCRDLESLEQITAFVIHMYETEKIRPGQVGVGLVTNLTSGMVRFHIERFSN